MGNSVQILAIGGDDLLIPAEGILLIALKGSVSLIIHIDIDEAITLLHLTGGQGNEVNTSPWRIGDDIHAVISGT